MRAGYLDQGLLEVGVSKEGFVYKLRFVTQGVPPLAAGALHEDRAALEGFGVDKPLGTGSCASAHPRQSGVKGRSIMQGQGDKLAWTCRICYK